MMHATTRPTTKRSRPEVWKHGANCYVNHGCRCAICTNGARESRARYARRPRQLESAPGRLVLEADDEDLEDDDLEDDNDEDLEDDDDEDDDNDEEIDD